MTGQPTMERAAEPLGRRSPLGPGDLGRQLEEHRHELMGYCRRLLGSHADAEDAVQETLLRAWRAYDRFEGRASLRSWLYRIATNVCFDQFDARRRRPDPIDLAAERSAASHRAATGAAVAVMRTDGTWIAPLTTGEGVDTAADPADQAVARDAIRQAFLATLLHLPPKQRSVLILRDVLRWRASEVAELLGTSEASVNSALQRAHATLAARSPGVAPVDHVDESQRPLLDSYVDAFLRHDVESLVSLVQRHAESGVDVAVG